MKNKTLPLIKYSWESWDLFGKIGIHYVSKTNKIRIQMCNTLRKQESNTLF